MSRYSAAANVVVEMSPTVDSAGTVQTFLFGERAGTTQASDTPASASIRGLVNDAGTWGQDLFGGNRMGGRLTPGAGSITLVNEGGVLDAWADYGFDGAPVTVRVGPPGAAYPAGYTTVYAAYGLTIKIDERQAEFVLKDRTFQLDKPIIGGGFTGGGGLDGSAVVASGKQWVAGDPGFVPVTLLDAASQLYYVQDANGGPLADYRFSVPTDETLVCPFDTYVGGVRLVRGANYASEVECLATAPSAGEVRFWFSADNQVWMRLGSTPEFQVRVFVDGYAPDGNHWTYDRVAARAGLSVPTFIGSGGSVTSRRVAGAETYLEVMDDAGFVDLIAYGFNRLDEFFSVRLEEPAATDTTVYRTTSAGGASVAVVRPVFTFTDRNASNWRRQPVSGMEAPYWCVNVSAGDVWPCECDPAASDTLRDYLTRQDAWVAFTGSNPAIKVPHKGAQQVAFKTPQRSFQNALDQSVWVNRYLGLFGGLRWILLLDADLTDETLAIELGDNAIALRNRYGCNAGRAFKVASKLIDVGQRRITFGLWGGTAGPGGFLSTGSGGAPAVVNLDASRNVMDDFAVFCFGTLSITGAGFVTMGDFVTASEGTVTGSAVTDLLLLRMEGSNGAAASTAGDSSAYARTVTQVATSPYDITLTTSSPLNGSSSAFVTDTGLNDQLRVERGSVGANYFPGDGGVEFFIKLVTDPTLIGNQVGAYFVMSLNSSNVAVNGTSVLIGFDGGSIGELIFSVDPALAATPSIADSVPFTLNVKTHICLQRIGTTWTLCKDGVSVGTYTSASVFGALAVGSTTTNAEGVGTAGLTGMPDLVIDGVHTWQGMLYPSYPFTPPASI